MKSRNLFKYGKIFAVLTILLCISPYYLIFFTSTYIICLVLLWLSSESLKNKLIWSIMPVLIGLLFMFVVNLIHHEYLKYKTLKLEVIIEENFNGEILIFDNIECGQSIQKNNDRYTLYIPKNGILFYSGDLTNEGYIDNIFKQKKGDSLILIPSLNESMFWENSKKYSNHSYTKNTLGVFNVIHYQNHGTKLTPIRKFVLTNKKNLDSINWFKRIQNKLEKIDTIPCNKKKPN